MAKGQKSVACVCTSLTLTLTHVQVTGVTLSDLANPKLESHTRNKEQFMDTYGYNSLPVMYGHRA